MAARIAPLPESEAQAPVTLPGADRPLNLLLTMAKNPGLTKGFVALDAFLLGDGVVPPRDREIVILRTGWLSASVYEFGQHRVMGAKQGLTDDEIAKLATWDPGFTGNDAALVLLADELCSLNTVTDATWQLLAQTYDEPQLLELVAICGTYRLVSGFLNAIGIEREGGVPGWPA